MICPNCTHEIPDSSQTCPICDKEIPPPESNEKDDRKHFSHYRVILKKPGPRKKIVGILSDATGLKEKEVLDRLTELPWIVLDRKPLNEAQEIKILLEMNKADVELKGIDIWAEEEVGIVKESSGPKKKKRISKFKALVILASVVIVLGGLIYLLTSITGGDQGNLLQKMGSGGQPEQRTTQGQTASGGGGSGTAGHGGGPIVRQIEKLPESFSLKFKGPNPFSKELLFALEAKQEIKVTIKIYDINYNQVTTLLNRTVSEGEYILRWRGNTSAEAEADRGLYFIETVTAEGRFISKIIWLTE
ncbi:MAG: hypothetical protein GY863_05360 [bacterium]|nr:hypothetical protein [bacterium]